jgi:hypothetical protein
MNPTESMKNRAISLLSQRLTPQTAKEFSNIIGTLTSASRSNMDSKAREEAGAAILAINKAVKEIGSAKRKAL